MSCYANVTLVGNTGTVVMDRTTKSCQQLDKAAIALADLTSALQLENLDSSLRARGVFPHNICLVSSCRQRRRAIITGNGVVANSQRYIGPHQCIAFCPKAVGSCEACWYGNEKPSATASKAQNISCASLNAGSR